MIQKGIHELLANPEEYKKYESPNGWGTVKGTLSFYKTLESYIITFLEEFPQLIDVGVIWVY